VLNGLHGALVPYSFRDGSFYSKYGINFSDHEGARMEKIKKAFDRLSIVRNYGGFCFR